MNILVTGSNGQLGSEIKDLAENYANFSFFFMDLPALDICNSSQLDVFFKDKNINTVINCAAYTAVDKAEQDVDIAEKVNSEGVLNLVNAVQKVQGKLIHISTDYVFDGNNFLPYQELDEVNPIGVYGNTKRSGELAVINSDIDGIVIRTSWLYSAYGNNFVKTMLRLGNEREELGVIFDQVGTPTNASDLAKACLDIFAVRKESKINSNGNLYHYSNEGVASWYDFAISIMELGGENCEVKPIQTKDYPTLAKRPQYSVLNKSKIKTDFKIEIPYWRDSLKDCIEKIKN
ncbi:dTDP-4-dehydrorhamnose reductase [Flavobacteriaceae bacterium]|nr:dTDP-4-dehydrorhamnose reductase [Flavobacteriaceae bacterium]